MKGFKRKAILFVVIGIFLLAGCTTPLDFFPPNKITVEGRLYRTGFYGDLYPDEFSFIGEEYSVGGSVAWQLDIERFDLMQMDKGFKTGGTIYCADSQWEEAKAYYADGENYIFYCDIDVPGEDKTKVIEHMDYEQFEALYEFSNKNEYTPFSSKERSGQKTIDFPDKSVSPRLKFYKQSKDGLFTSLRHHYYVVEDKMYLVRYYDYGEDKIYVMEIPGEIAAYFISLTESLLRN